MILPTTSLPSLPEYTLSPIFFTKEIYHFVPSLQYQRLINIQLPPSMDYSLTKPIFQFQNQQKYRRHLSKLHTIVNSKKNNLTTTHENFDSVHKLRHRSIEYQQKKSEQNINNENEKLLSRLIKISNRKKSLNISQDMTPKMAHYLNPARKIRERLITEGNHRFAERLIKRQSIFNTKAIKKEIEEYEKLKRTLTNNKKILRTSLNFNQTSKSLSRKSHYTTILKHDPNDLYSKNRSLII